MGPMTGRGLGYCYGYGAPGSVQGRGWGGGGRGWRHWYYATGLPGWARAGYPPARAYPPYWQPLTKERETEQLKNQAEALRHELEMVTRRLDELEKEDQ